MNKDAYYFSHDSNARNDQRLIKIRMKYGMEGYGVYFGIIEILREQSDYYLYKNEFTTIAYDLRVDEAMVEDIVLNYGLFVIDGKEYPHETFHSRSLTRRLEKMDEKKQKRVNAGRLGGIASAKVKQKSTDAKALNKTKLNKTKQKDINDRYDEFNDQSMEFILLYDEDTINDFVSYWTEPNKGNTKMKFEMQQTFDIKRRLTTWSKNDYGNKSNGVKKKINFTMPDGRNYLAWCDKCGKSDFYEPYNFNPDMIESRCCSAKILNERKKDVQKTN